MKVLVTGNAGFIGRHVTQLLASHGVDVYGLDVRPAPPEFAGKAHHEVDLLDRPALVAVFEEVRPAAVIHLAARTDLGGASAADYPANGQGVENLLAAISAAATVRRAICTSTQLVCRIGYRPAHDTDYAPNTAYGESKVATEKIWRQADGAGTDWCIVRPTTVWGPGMSDHYLRFFRYLSTGRYVHIGAARERKSYGFVGNTAHQYHALLTAPTDRVHGRTFYLADYEPLVLREWVELLREALGGPPVKTLPLWLARLGARAGDVLNMLGARRFPMNSFRLRNITTSYEFDLSDTQRVCGSLPYDISDGARITAEWVHRQLALPARS